MKLAVIFGGISTEHDVSVVSGTSVLKNLDKTKYEILPLYIDREGKWYEYTKDVDKIAVLPIGEEIKELKKVDNIIEVLKAQDVLFPVLHGLNGEDRNNTRTIWTFKQALCRMQSTCIKHCNG